MENNNEMLNENNVSSQPTDNLNPIPNNSVDVIPSTVMEPIPEVSTVEPVIENNTSVNIETVPVDIPVVEPQVNEMVIDVQPTTDVVIPSPVPNIEPMAPVIEPIPEVATVEPVIENNASVNIETVPMDIPVVEPQVNEMVIDVQPTTDVVIPTPVPNIESMAPVMEPIPEVSTVETVIENNIPMNVEPVSVVPMNIPVVESQVNVETNNIQPESTINSNVPNNIPIEHPAEKDASVVVPSPNMAAPTDVLTPAPLDEVTAIPETFGMEAYYKPVVDFSKERGLDEKNNLDVPNIKVEPSVNQENVNAAPIKATSKKGSKKLIFIIIGLLIVLLVAIAAYFLLFNKDVEEEKPKEEPKELAWNEKRPDWDSSTSKIKINNKATKLTCTYSEPLDEMTNVITYTHIYEDDIYKQVVVEDEIQFTEDTIKYYDYYVGSGEEEVEYQSEMYDNITIEVREKKTAVSIAYSFDLTASNENPKNMLDDQSLTKDEMKLKMENMGFVCE